MRHGDVAASSYDNIMVLPLPCCSSGFFAYFHFIPLCRGFLSFFFLLSPCSPSPITSLYPRFLHRIHFLLGLVSTGEAFFPSSFPSSFVVFLAFSI